MRNVSRPLIAVTGRHLPAGRVSRWVAGAVALPRTYTDALERAAAHPVLLPPMDLDDERDAGDVLAPFDGLVLTGGPDIDPQRYDQEPHPSVYGVDAVTDRFEFSVVDAAMERELPILAICRGHQLLNVALGGTLDQHITDRPGLLVHGDPGSGPGGGADHEVSVEPGTMLAGALGTTRCSVRSHHHQAVDELAPKATATAWSDDGVLEGFELSDGWVVSVQWHPEATAGDDAVQQRLFDAFVRAC
jgi:gamma-glutamyl-gamma-aminobutyrate hydrolase PuuD